MFFMNIKNINYNYLIIIDLINNYVWEGVQPDVPVLIFGGNEAIILGMISYFFIGNV